MALGMAVSGGPSRAETLADAVAIAYGRNPALVQQRFIQKSVDENYVQARAQYGPTVNLQANGTYTRAEQNGQVLHQNNGEAVATLTQPLYTSGRLRGQLLAARADVESGRETLRNTEQQLVQNVISVYAAVLRDEQRVQVGRENVLVLQDQLRQNRERYSRVGRGVGAGDVTLTDIGQSDARLAAAQISLASLEANLAISRGQYLQIVGQNPGTLEPLPELAGLPASVDEAFAEAEVNNPALLSAKYGEQASSANAASVRGERGPSVALTAQGVYQNRLSPFEGQLGTKEFVAGVTITQSLFASGVIRSRVRQADAQNGADQAALDNTRRQIVQSVTEAWSELAASRVALSSGERQVTSAQLAFAGMRREELNGLRQTIETLNAEQELVSAQLSFLQSRYTEYLARAALLSAVGSLRADAIARDVTRYDPATNFKAVRNRGRTPLEPLAMAVDRIGSANPRRPVVAELSGEDSPVPDAMPVLPPTPDAKETRGRLVPVTKSPLVPASALPGGLPPAPDLPATPAMPADAGL